MPLVMLSDVTPEPVTWLWPGRIPFGKITMVDGDPGLGKSCLTLDIAARLSVGTTLPDGIGLEPAGVVLLTVEDGLADTIQPRLAAAGADLTRVAALTAIEEIDDDGQARERLPQLPDDLTAIEDALLRVEGKLVIVDPVMSYLGEKTNSHRDQDVRRALTPLKALAERTGAAIVLVRHLNKMPGGNVLYRGGGSIGFIGIARAGLLVAPDPEDPWRRVVAVQKHNLAPPTPALAYRLVPGENGAVRVQWEGQSSYTADTLLAPPRDDEERGEASDAERFLLDALRDGPRPARELIAEARGISVGERTLKAAKARLRVTSEKAHSLGGSWSWQLPDPQDQSTAPFVPLHPLHSLHPYKDVKSVKSVKGQRVQVAPFTGEHPCVVCGEDRHFVRGVVAICADCASARPHASPARAD